MIPIRYPVSRPSIGNLEGPFVLKAVLDGQLSQGPQVLQFEQDFARWVGVDHAVATMNGTVALHLALAALGIGPGDEVIVPAVTYVATANAAAYCGARVVVADVEARGWGLDPESVRALVTGRTRAIIPVHLYGQPADLDPLREICTDAHHQYQKAPFLVEDAAQAHGALWGRHRVGSIGDCGTFSFYGNKILTTGEGGMVVTDDESLAERLLFLRGQAMDPARRYWHTEVGYNYRMTELQGALGCAQLKDAEAHVAARRLIGQWYRMYTADLPVTWQVPSSDDCESSHWLATCLLPPEVNREAVAAYLRARGIETRPAFPGLHTFPMYQDGQPRPIADQISARGLSLPTYRGLQVEDVNEICGTLAAALEAR